MTRPASASAPGWALVPRSKSLSRSKDFIDAQNYVIEGSQAQLIVQGMSLVRMKDSLWAKDTQKKSDKTKLFVDGKGQHLTSKEIRDAVRKGEEDKAVKLAEKLNRKEDREELKKKREEFDAWWTGIKEKHKEAVQKWQDQCKELTMQGLPKNRHPKKPKLMKKPDAPGAKPKNSGASSSRNAEVAGAEPDESRMDGGEQDPNGPDDPEDSSDEETMEFE